MADKQRLQQFRSRVMKQSILKSGLFGLLIGSCAGFVAAFVSWFFGYDDGLWLSIGILIGVSAISGVVLYFTKFRVTNSLLARKIDMLGLHERIVTMMELENDESYIAQRQRQDADEKLKTVHPKQLKFRMERKSIAAITTAVVLAPAMMVVCQLAAMGILGSGIDLINPAANDIPEIEIVYEVEEGGSIDGEEIQVIHIGENATPVMAIADEGWVFIGWDDGHFDPYREDKALTESKTFIAIFEQIEDDPNAEGEGEGEGQGQGAGDQPGEGQGSGSGNGDGGKGEGEGEGDGKGEGAGGKHSESNVVVNGRTDYGDLIADASQNAMDSMSSSDGSSTVIDIVSNYFQGLS